MTEKLSVLGSTGSIGTQSLDVAEMRGYEIIALTADRNAKTYRPHGRLVVACILTI